jgi:hypothetical protein
VTYSSAGYYYSGLGETSGLQSNIGQNVAFIDASGTTMGNSSAEALHLSMEAYYPLSALKRTAYKWEVGGINSAPHSFSYTSSGQRVPLEVTTHFKFYCSAGNILSADAVIIGLA